MQNYLVQKGLKVRKKRESLKTGRTRETPTLVLPGNTTAALAGPHLSNGHYLRGLGRNISVVKQG